MVNFKENELELRRVILRDVGFLKRMGLIDYSLLLAGEVIRSQKNNLNTKKVVYVQKILCLVTY